MVSLHSAPPGIEVITPRDRQAWLKARGRDVTASVVGALFGEHEFTTAYELWAIKTGRIPRSDEETPAMRRGRLLERVAVDLLREERPDWKITHNAAENIYFRDPVARLGATPDLIVEAPGLGLGVVQVKSVEQSVYRKKWLDEEGYPEPPFWIALQATLEAHLVGAQWAAVAPLVVGHGLDMPLIDVPLDHKDGVIAAMTERAAEFWGLIDDGREPPVDYARDASVIEAIYAVGDPREEADLTGDPLVPVLIDQIVNDRATLKAVEGRITAAEAQIKAAMGSAELAHIIGGQRITWKTHTRRDPATGRLSAYRVLRLPRA